METLNQEAREHAEFQRFIVQLSASGLVQRTPKMLALEKELSDMWRPLVNVLGRQGEDKACALFDYGITAGLFGKLLHPSVSLLKKEFQLPCGRVDRALEHEDGSYTVVEIKPSGSRRDQAHGLGQAIMYASSMRGMLNDNRDVRAALFVSADHDNEIASACKSVGVQYLCLPFEAQGAIEGLAAIHAINVM